MKGRDEEWTDDACYVNCNKHLHVVNSGSQIFKMAYRGRLEMNSKLNVVIVDKSTQALWVDRHVRKRHIGGERNKSLKVGVSL